MPVASFYIIQFRKESLKPKNVIMPHKCQHCCHCLRHRPHCHDCHGPIQRTLFQGRRGGNRLTANAKSTAQTFLPILDFCSTNHLEGGFCWEGKEDLFQDQQIKRVMLFKIISTFPLLCPLFSLLVAHAVLGARDGQ